MTEYEKFLQELETFILWKINRRKWILFLFREMDIRRWQSRQLYYIRKGLLPAFFQVEDIVLHWENLWGFRQNLINTMKIIIQNGTF